MKSDKRMMKKFVSLLIVCVLVFLSTATYSLAAKSVAQLESEKAVLSGELASINSEIVEMQLELEETEGLLEIASSNIEKTEEALVVATEEEGQQYEDMKDRIQFLYESGDMTFLEIVLGAEDLVDLINRADFVNSVTEYDREMLEKLTETKETIEVEKDALEADKQSLLELEEEYKLTEKELKEKAEETKTDLSYVKTKLSEAEAAAAAAAAQAEAEANAGGSNSSSGGSSSSGSSGGASSGSSSSNGSSSSGSTSSGGSYEASASELDTFAALLDCEAGPSSYTAQLAVATVIMNRVESGRFPNTVKGVIYAKGQFPPAHNGKVSSVIARGPSASSYRAAQDAMNGVRLSSVDDCYYFLMASSTSRKGTVVGGNLFFATW